MIEKNLSFDEWHENYGISLPNMPGIMNTTLKEIEYNAWNYCQKQNENIINKLTEIIKTYADLDNWGHYDQSGCPKSGGTDACFIGPEAAQNILKELNL